MKTLSIQKTVNPRGYTGKPSHFNKWQRQLQKEIDKISKTNVNERMAN